MSPSEAMSVLEQGANLQLQVRRVIPATRQRVYEAWTKPEILRQWFGPGNMTVPSAATELRVGGAYRIQMEGSAAACEGNATDSDTSRTAVASGVYTKLVPNELLSFTWKGDWDPTEETLVTVALRDVEGGTEMTLTHERFATAESRGKHEHGWTLSTQKLAKVCEGSGDFD